MYKSRSDLIVERTGARGELGVGRGETMLPERAGDTPHTFRQFSTVR